MYTVVRGLRCPALDTQCRFPVGSTSQHYPLLTLQQTVQTVLTQQPYEQQQARPCYAAPRLRSARPGTDAHQLLLRIAEKLRAVQPHLRLCCSRTGLARLLDIFR